MTAPVLPFVPAAVRALLVAAPAFTALVPAARVTTRAPDDVTAAFVLVRPGGGALPVEVSGGVWSPMVQVDAYSPGGSSVDPEVVVWRVAATAAAVLSRARNVGYQSMHYSARVVDGPLTDVDTSRGPSSPLYRALIRAELRVHVR